jgi:YVTN family beta-propeller protein
MPFDAQLLAGPEIPHQMVGGLGAGARRIVRLRLVGLALCLGLSLAAARASAQPFAYVTSARYGEPGRVSVIDTRTRAVVASVQVDAFPYSVAISPDGRRIYVGSIGSGRSVSVIDAPSHRVVKSGLVGYLPNAMVVSRDGTRLYVADGSERSVHEVDAQSLEVLRSVAVGQNILGMVMSADGSLLFATNGASISVILVSSLEVGGRLTSASGRSLALDPANRNLYAVANGVLRAVRLLDYQSRWSVQLPVSHVGSVALSPDGRRLYVGDEEKGQVAVVDMETRRLLKLFRTAAAPTRGLSLTPDGSALYVLVPSRERVIVFDTATGKVLARIRVGGRPQTAGVFIGPARIAESPSLPAELRDVRPEAGAGSSGH